MCVVHHVLQLKKENDDDPEIKLVYMHTGNMEYLHMYWLLQVAFPNGEDDAEVCMLKYMFTLCNSLS